MQRSKPSQEPLTAESGNLFLHSRELFSNEMYVAFNLTHTGSYIFPKRQALDKQEKTVVSPGYGAFPSILRNVSINSFLRSNVSSGL